MLQSAHEILRRTPRVHCNEALDAITLISDEFSQGYTLVTQILDHVNEMCVDEVNITSDYVKTLVTKMLPTGLVMTSPIVRSIKSTKYGLLLHRMTVKYAHSVLYQKEDADLLETMQTASALLLAIGHAHVYSHMELDLIKVLMSLSPCRATSLAEVHELFQACETFEQEGYSH